MLLFVNSPSGLISKYFQNIFCNYINVYSVVRHKKNFESSYEKFVKQIFGLNKNYIFETNFCLVIAAFVKLVWSSLRL